MIRIESLSQFVEQVTTKGKTTRVEVIGFKNHLVHFYRGHSDIDYKLLPSIARKDKNGLSNFVYESKMIQRAKLRNPIELANIDHRINLLAKLQHYGLETRLLDITENALVALYFACCSNKDKDGEVIIFEIVTDMIQFPGSFLSEFYLHFSTYEGMKIPISNCVDGFFYDNPHLFKSSSYANEDAHKKSFIDSIRHFAEDPLFINHSIQSEREIRQQAAFILFGNKYVPDGNVFYNEIVPIDKKSSLINEIILIPKECKESLINDLKLLGITKEFLFPEFHNRCKSINNEIRNIFPDNSVRTGELWDEIFLTNTK